MTLGLGVVIAATVLAALGLMIATLPEPVADDADRRSLEPGAGTPRSATDRGDAASTRPAMIRAAIGALIALVVFATSGWLLPAVVVGVVVSFAVGRWQARSRFGASEVDRIDALASWIENLRDVLVAGDQPIGAIRATVATCPPAIRAPVRRLATALGHQEPGIAFRRFADDIDDPIGDLVATGLLVAVQRGARTVAVLSALAEQARAQADRRRVLDAERAPVQREVMLLSLIMGTLLLAVLVFGRASYLAPYDTSGGQLFLATIVALYGLLLLRVQQLARFPRPGRFLTTTTASPTSVGAST